MRTLALGATLALLTLTGCATNGPEILPDVRAMHESSVEVDAIGNLPLAQKAADRACGLSGRKAEKVGWRCNQYYNNGFNCLDDVFIYACTASTTQAAKQQIVAQ
jgi:predicted small lipoprotein YifL